MSISDQNQVRLDRDAPVNRVYPLNLGTVDVPRSVVHSGTDEIGWTVPLIAYLILQPDGGPILVDNGFDVDVIPRIPTVHTLRPEALAESLAVHGLGFADFRTVVNTHLHADHAGMNKAFDGAEIVVQRAEYAYATSATGEASHGYRPRSAFSDVPESRFRLVDGDIELAPGIMLVHTPGHTPGHQAVAVRVQDGWVMLTGDACDDEQIWSGRQLPGIVENPDAFRASLARMHQSGAIPLWPHDLEFSRLRMLAEY